MSDLRDYEDYMRREFDEPDEPRAMSVFNIHGDDTHGYEIAFWTNDDEDLGYPSTEANDVYGPFRTLADAVRFTGGMTRQGVGCYVEVYLNGELMTDDLDHYETRTRIMRDEIAKIERMVTVVKQLKEAKE